MYKITKEQLDTLERIREVLMYDRDNINKLCTSQRDEIVYGFELGKLYSSISRVHLELIEITSDISDQELLPQ